MASCRAVQALDPQPRSDAIALTPVRSGPPLARDELARRLGRLRVSGRWLDQCLGARAGAWLARTLGLAFAVTALTLARPLPDAAVAVLRLSLVALSWCVALPALSLAGPALERSLADGRGLFESRGIALGSLRAERPLLLLRWALRQLGVLVALVLAACVVSTDEAWRASRLLALAVGAGVYLVALGAGAGVIAHGCHELGKARGRALLTGVVLVPELLAPAWPELPTLVRSYAALLDACLGLGVRW